MLIASARTRVQPAERELEVRVVFSGGVGGMGETHAAERVSHGG